jgi:hypothetical protein
MTSRQRWRLEGRLLRTLPETVDRLTPLLTDPNPHVKLKACEAMLDLWWNLSMLDLWRRVDELEVLAREGE